MNNIKLEVVRINEDVIATSSCDHYKAKYHVLVTLNDGIADNNPFYEYKNGSLVFLQYGADQDITTHGGDGLDSDGWWWSEDDYDYYKCNDAQGHAVKNQ